MAAIVEYFVSRSIFVNLLTVLLILAGGYKAYDLNKEAFPNVDFDVLVVTTIYPGASPEEVEKLVTKPLEDSIKEVDGIKKYDSASLENRSGIFVTIDPDVKDSQKVIDDVRAAVDRTEDLPEDTEKTIITEATTAQTPVIEYFLGRVEKDGKFKVSEQELKKQVEILEKRLEKIDGVSRISRRGWRDTEMQISLNPHKLDQYYIGSGAVINALKNRNINFPGGTLESKGKEIIVRTIGEFNSAKEIKRVVVRSNEIGRSVRVGDVAHIKQGLKESLYIEKSDGYPSITLTVVKRRSADAIEVVDASREIIKQYKSELKGKYKTDMIVGDAQDLSFFIRRRLGILISNGIVGLILVVISLFIFLGWRTALMATLGIPVAMGMTFIAMDMLDISMNLISMFGLILVIGIIVDDAIIVCENCYRYIEEGMPAYDAVVRGAKEVIAPVMATISTTIAAFGPMLFMTGIFGKFVFFIPSVVILALIASLLESFFILPGHLYDINKNVTVHKENEKKASWFDALRDRFYMPTLRWSINHRSVVLTSMFTVLFMAIGAQATWGGFELFPGAVDAALTKIELPNGTPKEKTEEYANVVEYYVKKLPIEYEGRTEKEQEHPLGVRELKNFTTRIGIIQKEPNDPFVKRGSQYAMLNIFLTPEESRNRSTSAITDILRKQTLWILTKEARQKELLKIAAAALNKNPELSILQLRDLIIKTRNESEKNMPAQYKHMANNILSLTFEKYSGGPPVGRPVAINITGDDFNVLEKIGAEYKAILRSIPQVQDIDDNFQAGKNEMRFRINEELAGQAGISVASAALALNTAYQGTVATTIKRANEEVDVLVRFDEKYRKSERYWRSINIPNARGQMIPLSAVASFSRGTSKASISHRDGTRLMSIGANLVGISSSEANTLIKGKTKDIIKKYPGYSVEFGGENKDTAESLGSLGRSFAVGAIIIIMILVSLFKSFSQPLVVMMAIPFSLIGVIIAFLTHGHPFSFLGMMGVIGLSGVVVNDSIVLVDFANTLRDEHPDWSIDEIVLAAGKLRFRAVLLTTITTVIGLLPTAYGIGGYDPFLVPMALGFSWGLFFATFLTLVFVPILYKSEHNMKLRLFKSYRAKYGQGHPRYRIEKSNEDESGDNGHQERFKPITAGVEK